MEAPAGEDMCLTAVLPGELLDEPRLPQACLAYDPDGDGHPLTFGLRVGGAEEAHLFVAAHQRDIETDRQRAQACLYGPEEEPVRAGPLGLDGPGGELLDLRADEDLAGPGGLRERHRPGSHIPREPERARAPDQGLTGRQAEAVDQVGAVAARQGGRFGAERLAHFQAGPRGAQCVVLVQRGDAEHAHQMLAVAGRQLSAVPLEHGGQGRDHVLVHDAVGLRIQRHG